MVGRVASPAFWEEEVARAIARCPAPSSGCWELYWRFHDVEDDLDAAVEVAGSDPGFAAEAIRHASAARYGRREIASLREAASAMGLDGLKRLALAHAYRGFATEPLRVYGYSEGEFFRKSLACASAMEFLHEETAGGRMYTLGLLHGIGELFIDAAICAHVVDPIVLVAGTAQKLSAIEESFLGLNQARVAGMVLRAWEFPPSVVLPIEQQFSAQPGSRHFEAAQSLAIARFVAGKVVHAARGHAVNATAKRHVVFRGKLLSDVYEYALRQSDSFADAGAVA